MTTRTSVGDKRAQRAGHALAWKPLDIAVGAGLGAVAGLIYWAASLLASWIFPLMTALLPGMAALLHGIFYFPCTLSLLIIRKPGTAVYVGIISVLVEILPGNAYTGPMIFVQALLEALCAELAFGIFRYRRWSLGTTLLGGLLIALVYNAFLLAFYYQGVAFLSPRGLVGTACEIISGLFFAGLVSWLLFKAIVRTGALDRLASGHDLHVARSGI